MKRERPPMPPLRVRVQVAERQLHRLELQDFSLMYERHVTHRSLSERLDWLLFVVFAGSMDGGPFLKPELALDHDPALILRRYDPRIKDVASRYTPHAHDPDYLIYREKADHQQKTTGRKPGAERTVTTKGSDIWLKTKFARLEKPRKKRQTIVPRGFSKRPRPFPPGRKLGK